jgi:hypothetical protein
MMFGLWQVSYLSEVAVIVHALVHPWPACFLGLSEADHQLL